MTKIAFTVLAILAIVTGAAFAAPKGQQTHNYPWQAEQTDFQLQGR